MARRELRVHPEAALEAERARDWYERRSYLAADAFARELEAAFDDIVEVPEAWPPYRDRYRRRILPRFPFSIVYRLVGDVVEIVGVVHHKKRPGYWATR